MQIKNEALVKKLEKTGFSNKEALIYVSLLELGGATPSKIAEYSGLKRGIIYNILTTLSVRGLINEIDRKNKMYYQIDKPEKIFRYTKNRAEQVNDDLDRVKEIIPEIEGLFSIVKNRPKVTYYENTDGILSLYEDMLGVEKAYEMLVFSKTDGATDFYPKNFIPTIAKKKAEHGITTRAIVPNTSEGKNFSETHYNGVPEKIWPKCRFLDPTKFPLEGEIIIYGDSKISIVNMERNQLIGVIIEDKALHNMMRTIFELSWNSSLVKGE